MSDLVINHNIRFLVSRLNYVIFHLPKQSCPKCFGLDQEQTSIWHMPKKAADHLFKTRSGTNKGVQTSIFDCEIRGIVLSG